METSSGNLNFIGCCMRQTYIFMDYFRRYNEHLIYIITFSLNLNKSVGGGFATFAQVAIFAYFDQNFVIFLLFLQEIRCIKKIGYYEEGG